MQLAIYMLYKLILIIYYTRSIVPWDIIDILFEQVKEINELTFSIYIDVIKIY